jgi:hypothetical protein
VLLGTEVEATARALITSGALLAVAVLLLGLRYLLASRLTEFWQNAINCAAVMLSFVAFVAPPLGVTDERALREGVGLQTPMHHTVLHFVHFVLLSSLFNFPWRITFPAVLALTVRLLVLLWAFTAPPGSAVAALRVEWLDHACIDLYLSRRTPDAPHTVYIVPSRPAPPRTNSRFRCPSSSLSACACR